MRLTLDLDNVTLEKLKNKVELIKRIFPDKEVYYRMSSSGRGGHIKVHNIDCDSLQIMNMRYLLGDDVRRISKDNSRAKYGLPTQVLFTFKRKANVVTHSSEWVRA